MSIHSIVDGILCAISDLPVHPPASADPSITNQPHAPAQSNNPLLNLPPDAARDAKSLFVTLHVMFPHEFLPALDLLDRGLVNKLVPIAPTLTTISNESQSTATKTSSASEDTSIRSTGAPKSAPTDFNTSDITPPSDLYYIQSASAVLSNQRASHAQHSLRHPSSDNPHTIFSTSNPNTKGYDRNRNRNRATQMYYEVRLDTWNCSCAAFAFCVLNSLGVDDREGGGGEGGEVFRDSSKEGRGRKVRESEGEGLGGGRVASAPDPTGGERDDGTAVAGRLEVNEQQGVGEPHRRTSSERRDETSVIPNTSSKNSIDLAQPDQPIEDADPSNQAIHNNIGDADEAATAKLSTAPTTQNHPHCRFGGTLTHDLTHPSTASTASPIPRPVPTCKHTLAAILAKAAPNLFVEGQHVKVLKVQRDELGGWAGGWGGG